MIIVITTITMLIIVTMETTIAITIWSNAIRSA